MLLQVMTCFGLQSSRIESDISPCATKFVVVDVKETTDDLIIHVHYDICHIQDPICYVQNDTNQPCEGDLIQKEETIQEAQFIDKNEKINYLPHDKQKFTVSTIHSYTKITNLFWYYAGSLEWTRFHNG